jgi:hypothetical protein
MFAFGSGKQGAKCVRDGRDLGLIKAKEVDARSGIRSFALSLAGSDLNQLNSMPDLGLDRSVQLWPAP